jgi:AcrR family transcriptional regulator
MTREEIVDAGLEIVRQDGFAALTMAALAQRLGVSAMTAYGYVGNKQELSRLIVDRVLADVAVPEPSEGDWARRIALIERRARDALKEVRGARQIVAMYGATPHGIRLADAIVAILREAGFGLLEATFAFDTLFTYVMGQLGLDDDLADPQHQRPDALVTFHPPNVEQDNEELFDYGLATILRGLRANLADGGPRR